MTRREDSEHFVMRMRDGSGYIFATVIVNGVLMTSLTKSLHAAVPFSTRFEACEVYYELPVGQRQTLEIVKVYGRMVTANEPEHIPTRLPIIEDEQPYDPGLGTTNMATLYDTVAEHPAIAADIIQCMLMFVISLVLMATLPPLWSGIGFISLISSFLYGFIKFIGWTSWWKANK